MTWHAGATELARYATGAVDDATASSVEAHLVSCSSCRARVATHVEPLRMEQVWSGVIDAIDRPRPRLVERLLHRLGVSDGTARLLAATPSLQLSWLAAVAGTLAFAVLAAQAGPNGLALFLVVAPLVPLAGVAAAFGPELDRNHEISAATPTAGWRLLLLRGCAVFGTTLVVAGLAALGLPDLHWTSAAWILPALSLTLAALGLATFTSIERAATAVAVFWVTAVSVAAYGPSDWMAAFGTTGQTWSLAVIAVAVIVIIQRRDAFELRSRP